MSSEHHDTYSPVSSGRIDPEAVLGAPQKSKEEEKDLFDYQTAILLESYLVYGMVPGMRLMASCLQESATPLSPLSVLIFGPIHAISRGT